MIKRQIFSITLLIISLSVILGMPGVFASNNTQEPIATATPNPTYTKGDGLAQITTFGNPEIERIFSSGDGKKLLFSFDNKLDIFDESAYEYFDRLELTKEFNNSLLGVNEDGELVALQASKGFYIYNTNSRIKSATYEGGGEGYSFYSFMPLGKALLYGVHHSSTIGNTTDILLRGVDAKNNILSLDFLPPPDTQPYYQYSSPVPSPDNTYIAAGYTDALSNRILVWKIDDQGLLYQINNLPGAVNTLDIEPDSKTFVSGGEDGIIRIWNMETGEPIGQINGFDAAITSVQYAEKGKELSITTANKKFYTYNFASKQLKQLSKSEEMENALLIQKIKEGYILKSDAAENNDTPPASLVFSPDGNKVALIQGSVQVWDVGGTSFISSFLPDNRFRFANAVFDEASERLAVLSDQGDIYVWNTTTNQTDLYISHQKTLDGQQSFTPENVSLAANHDFTDFSNQNIVFSPDGQQIAFANGMNIEVWNIILKAKNKTLSVDGSLGRPEKLYFSEDGNNITAITNTNQYAVTWEVRSGKLIDQLEMTNAPAPSGSRMKISGSYYALLNSNTSDPHIELWNRETLELFKLSIANSEVSSFGFNEGETLFSAIDQSTNLYIWRTDNGQLLYYQKGFSPNNALAVNPGGTILATALNGNITFWNIEEITQNGFKAGFVSPTLVPMNNGGFTFNQNPTVTPTQIASPTISLPTEENSPEISGDTQATEVVENNEPDLLKAQQNQGIVNSVKWQSNKVLFSSSTGLYSYDPVKDLLSIVFNNEEMDISSIEGFSTASYLAAGISEKNLVQLWNQKKPEQILAAAGYSQPVISPNKKWMVYYLGNTRYMLWDISSKKSKLILPAFEPSILPVFSPNSSHLVIAQKSGLVQVWNTESGVIELAVTANSIPCSQIQFTRDGKSIIGVAGGSVFIWPLLADSDPVEISIYDEESSKDPANHDQVATAADINFNNEILAIADNTGTIRFYTLEDQNLYRNLTQPNFEITRLSFSPKDNRLLSVDINGNSAIWDADSSELLNDIQFFSGLMEGITSLDDGNVASWTKSKITIYDPSTLEVQKRTVIDAEEIFDISMNGLWAAAYSPYSISIFDTSTGDIITTFEEEAEIVNDARAFYGAAFSANSKYLIAYGTGGAWIYQLNQDDPANSSLLGYVDAAQIRVAALNDDGSRFMLSTGEGYLRPKVYETSNQTEVVELQLAEYQTNLTGGQEYSVYAFGPDLEKAILLRSGLYNDARLELYDIASGEIIQFIRYDVTTADALAVSKDGALIAAGFDTGEIRIYNASDLSLVHEFYAHPGSVNQLTFSDDGNYLISSGLDGSIKSWIIE